MRLSVRVRDTGYNPGLAKKARVFLDGKSMDTSQCFCADEERGEVYVYETDKYGNLIVTYDHMGPELKTKVLRGKVEITFDD